MVDGDSYHFTAYSKFKEKNDKPQASGFQVEDDEDLFMGGIPNSMPEEKVRKLCESFGQLKKFMLQRDPVDPRKNRGYCFFEYVDPRATEKAIKHLNNIEFKDKKLKV